MIRKAKVTGIVCGVCAMLGGAGYFAYEATCNYIWSEKSKSWNEGYKLGQKHGEHFGRCDALWYAKLKGYITQEQYDELIKMN